MSADLSSPFLSLNQRRIFLLALLLYTLALLIRLDGIRQIEPHPDERHWVVRTEQFLHRLRGTPYAATTHLGQPGIPAVFVMSVAQYATHIFDRLHFKLDPSARPADLLVPSRVAIALASSLLIPLLFLSLIPIFGLTSSFFAAALLLFDPTHVGYSRIAHLDALQALFVCMTVFIWYRSFLTDKVSFAVVAGVFWGLAVATKPTAVALPIAFLIFRVFARFFGQQRRSILHWNDVWSLLVGHAVFALIYTRLWVHASDYRVRLGIRSYPADVIYAFGMFLQTHLFTVLLPLMILIGISLWAHWDSFKVGSWKSKVFKANEPKILAMLLLMSLALVPQVFENFARFWSWVAGLKNEVHVSLGHSWPVLPFAYSRFFLSRLPEWVLLGCLVTTFIVILQFSRRSSHQLNRFLILNALIIVCWGTVLSFSGKQTWRYMVPTLPSIYVVAAWGLGYVGRRLPTSRMQFVAGLVTVLLQMSVWLYFRPYHQIYYNYLCGGVKQGVQRTQAAFSLGTNEALSFLMKKSYELDRPLYISVAEDESVLAYSAQRLFGGEAGRLRFNFYPSYVADYILGDPLRMQYVLGSTDRRFADTASLLQVRFHDVVLAEVHEIPEYKYDKPLSISLTNVHHQTGKKYRGVGKGVRLLRADPLLDGPGNLVELDGFRAWPGIFRLSVELRKNDIPKSEHDFEVLQISMGSQCVRSINLSDLRFSGDTKSFDLDCKVETRTHLWPVIAWRGHAPVSIVSLVWNKIADSPDNKKEPEDLKQ